MKRSVFICIIVAIICFAAGGFLGYGFAGRENKKQMEDITAQLESMSSQLAAANEANKQNQQSKEETEAQVKEEKTTPSSEVAKETEKDIETIDAEKKGLEEKDEASASFVGGPAQQKADSLSSELHNNLPADNGSWSVFVADLKNNAEMSIDSHRMQAASLIKLYIMAAIYEDYERYCGEYGAEEIDNNLYYMITVSDNDSANYLAGVLGGGDTDAGMAAVNDFCVRKGFNDTHMGRLLLHSNEFDDNYTSVKDCGEFLKQVYRAGKGLDGETMVYADKMFSLLCQQARRNKLPSQMPDEVTVANKTGELGDVENDAGILFDSPNGNDLVVVFMSENLWDCESAQGTIGSLGRFIYDYYSY